MRWFLDECYFNLYRHSNKYWVGAKTSDAMELPKLSEAQEKVSVGIVLPFAMGENWLSPSYPRIGRLPTWSRSLMKLCFQAWTGREALGITTSL